MKPSTTLLRAASRYVNPTYNPLTAITWHSAFWAEDPSWTNPGNGNGVSSWRDGSTNGHTLTQGTAGLQPKFYSAVASLNGQPGITFDGTDDFLNTAGFPAVAPVYTFVSVCAYTSLNSGTVLSNGASQVRAPGATGAFYRVRFGGSVTINSTVAMDTNAHLQRAMTLGGAGLNEKLWTDEFLGADGDSLGVAQNLGAVYIGRDAFNYWGGSIAFAALYNAGTGDVSDAAAWPAFKAWVANHYRITLP